MLQLQMHLSIAEMGMKRMPTQDVGEERVVEREMNRRHRALRNRVVLRAALYAVNQVAFVFVVDG